MSEDRMGVTGVKANHVANESGLFTIKQDPFKTLKNGAGELGQWLRAPIALPEEPHGDAPLLVTPAPRGLAPPSGL